MSSSENENELIPKESHGLSAKEGLLSVGTLLKATKRIRFGGIIVNEGEIFMYIRSYKEPEDVYFRTFEFLNKDGRVMEHCSTPETDIEWWFSIYRDSVERVELT